MVGNACFHLGCDEIGKCRCKSVVWLDQRHGRGGPEGGRRGSIMCAYTESKTISHNVSGLVKERSLTPFAKLVKVRESARTCCVCFLIRCIFRIARRDWFWARANSRNPRGVLAAPKCPSCQHRRSMRKMEFRLLCTSELSESSKLAFEFRDLPARTTHACSEHTIL